MHTEQAKAILQHYRPTVDAEEPYFREALEQVQRDPELAQWLTEHCASYEAVRRALRPGPRARASAPRRIRWRWSASAPSRSCRTSRASPSRRTA